MLLNPGLLSKVNFYIGLRAAAASIDNQRRFNRSLNGKVQILAVCVS